MLVQELENNLDHNALISAIFHASGIYSGRKMTCNKFFCFFSLPTPSPSSPATQRRASGMTDSDEKRI
jgi:hypothetical protein